MSTRKKISYTNEAPEGLFYIPAFLSDEEETLLLQKISAESFQPYNYNGYMAKREIVFYGSSDGYRRGTDEIAGPVPG